MFTYVLTHLAATDSEVLWSDAASDGDSDSDWLLQSPHLRPLHVATATAKATEQQPSPQQHDSGADGGADGGGGSGSRATSLPRRQQGAAGVVQGPPADEPGGVGGDQQQPTAVTPVTALHIDIAATLGPVTSSSRTAAMAAVAAMGAPPIGEQPEAAPLTAPLSAAGGARTAIADAQPRHTAGASTPPALRGARRLQVGVAVEGGWKLSSGHPVVMVLQVGQSRW